MLEQPQVRRSKNSKVQDWNQATNLVIAGQAGEQIMGDWPQGEFAAANQLAGNTTHVYQD